MKRNTRDGERTPFKCGMLKVLQTNKQKRVLQSADGRPTKRTYARRRLQYIVIVMNKERGDNVNNSDGPVFTLARMYQVNCAAINRPCDARWHCKQNIKTKRFHAHFHWRNWFAHLSVEYTNVAHADWRYTAFGWKESNSEMRAIAKIEK